MCEKAMQVRPVCQITKIVPFLGICLEVKLNWRNFALLIAIPFMKRIQIIVLVAIAAVVACLMIFMKDLSTYDSIASAKSKQGKFVHLIARLDKSIPMDYDPANNPNYLSFVAKDSLGASTKVIYHNTKPAELEQSERIVLKGKMQGDVFECSDILLKCPSKYKDDKKELEKTVVENK